MKIVWCEQAGILEDKRSFMSMLNAKNIDYRRLNWKHGADDVYANVFTDSEGVSWSKGREVLYESVKSELQIGDYIIFADDDIEFVDHEKGIEALVNYLEVYSPQLAVPYSTNWHHTKTLKSLKDRSSSPFPIFLADLEVQIMRRDFAELVFPVLYDGGRGTLWYAFFFNSMISGYGALCLPDCHVKNLRSRARSVNYGGQVALKSNAIWIESRPILPFAVRLAQRLLGHKRVGIARIFNSLYARFPRLMIRPEADAIARVKRFRQAVADSQ